MNKTLKILSMKLSAEGRKDVHNDELYNKKQELLNKMTDSILTHDLSSFIEIGKEASRIQSVLDLKAK